MATITSYLDDYFEPFSAMLTPETARKILELKPGEDAAARVAELGSKADDGTLTDLEREEYEAFVDAGDLIALLKAKARRYLKSHPG